jgi:hypothetical protein
MVSVAAFGAFGVGPANPPDLLRPSLQVLVGLSIGARFGRDSLQALRRMVWPALLVSSWWILSGLGLGWVLHHLTHLDLITALVGSTAGGLVEMSTLSVSLGADAAIVTVLQFFRVSTILVAVPLLGPKLFPAGAWRRDAAVTASSGPPPPPSPLSHADRGLIGQGGILVLAAGAGLGLHALGLPAGGIMGATLGVGAARVLGFSYTEPRDEIRLAAQLGLGSIIGLNFTADTLASLVQIALPVAILTSVVLVNGFALAAVLRRLTGWRLETCVVSTSAGGLTQMSMIAEDFGADPVVVSLLHLVRLVAILAVTPSLLTLLSR